MEDKKTPASRAPLAGNVLDEMENFLEKQDALDNHESNGPNAEDYFAVLRRRNVARKHLDAALASLHVDPPISRQYYYRMAGCKAEQPRDPECICWHDEGTDCLDSRAMNFLSPVIEDTERGARFTWRDKPTALAPVAPTPKE